MTEQLKQIAQGKEAKEPSEQQKVFYEHWKQEAARANQAEKLANQQARDRMKGLTAPELRKIGAKQLLWGWGLQFINLTGQFIGGVGGFLGTTAAVGALVGSGSWIPVAAGLAVGTLAGIGGAVAGSELVRTIYEKVARKFDKSLPTLDKDDRTLGDILSVVAGLNPPMVAGVRNIFEGYNQMKRIQ